MANPKIVLKSITDSQESVGNVTVHPVTISRYAFLELLDSPFVNPNKKFEINTIIPSVYVMSIEAAELRKYSSKTIEKLVEDAYVWADGSICLSDVPGLIQCVLEQMNTINKAAPEAQASEQQTVVEGSKKK